MQRDTASYRDPDGYVAHDGDKVFRCVTDTNAPICQEKFKDFFAEAIKKGLLVPFEATSDKNVFELKKLPIVTYPYEWSFSQLKQAAFLTLNITLLALKYGLTLKDATAFNVQPFEGRMVFIDHTSFEETDKKMPWRPYSQFCKHFLAPLLMASRTGRHVNKHFRLNLDGVDLGEAKDSLSFKDRFNPTIFTHIYMHHALTKKHEHSNDQPQNIERKGDQKAYIEHLRRVIDAVKPPKYCTEWYDYYDKTNYEDAAFLEKESLIKQIINDKHYGCIWDMGANNGHFSRLIAPNTDMVVSMDIDHAAVDYNVVENNRKNLKNIYPLVMDITNPSPALGFANQERLPIGYRAQPDLMMALALIHHLTITYNLPFSMVAEHIRSYDAELIIEFVDREDSQVKKLLCNKDDDYAHYNREEFEKAFLVYFKCDTQKDVAGTHRTIYHFKPK